MTIKSPCLTCNVHLDRLDKLDPRYGCDICERREAYAAACVGVQGHPDFNLETMLTVTRLNAYSQFQDVDTEPISNHCIM